MALDSTPEHLSRRLIALERGSNFRDLGGYTGTSGRKVKWGLIFRSGSLAHLSATDQATLAARGIRTVCDLRTSTERLREPSAGLGARTLSWDYELDHGAVIGAVSALEPRAESVRAAIMEFYRTAPEDFGDRFRELFQALCDAEVPLVIHCTAGKDRTGVAAALVLAALGVTRSELVEDYALSERCIDYDRTLGGSAASGGSWMFLNHLAPEVRAPLFASEPGYIEAMLDGVTECYGSLEQYLRMRLHVDAADLGRLRRLYLEP
jgi:protein-tyrosine phosphatase